MIAGNDVYATGRGDSKDDKDSVKLGYNAAVNTGNRQAPRTKQVHEDRVLTVANRKRIDETALDQSRNYSLVAWAIRKHLDFVSQFSPQVRTGDKAVDDILKRELRRSGRRRGFDIAGKHSREQAMRFFEQSKVLDGQSGIIEIKGGLKQLVEGKMIGKPDDLPKRWADKVNDSGLVIDRRTGRTNYYCVRKWNADGTKLVYGRMVNADDMHFDAYFPRINANSGVSPLSTALNQFQDLYENFEYTLLKIKLHSLFGIKITRDAGDDDGFDTELEGNDDSAGGVSAAGGVGSEIELGKGILTMNLDPGEDVGTIESNTPSTEFVNFSTLVTRIALLALDIPYLLLDQTQASFSAIIAAREDYLFSAKSKQQKNIEILEEITARDVMRLVMDQATGLGRALNSAGMSAEEAADGVSWIPVGVPFLDKLKEVSGDEKAIGIGIESTPRAARRRGVDAFQMIEEQAEFLERAKELGVPITIGSPGQATTEEKEAATNG